MTTGSLERGRASFERSAWNEAFSQLSAADRRTPLDPDDLERLATTAYLIGRDAESIEFLARAYHDHVSREDLERSARCALWLSFELLNAGEMAPGAAWVARARQLLEGRPECAELGLLAVVDGLASLEGGDLPAAREALDSAAEIGARHGDRDLLTLAHLGRGLTLIFLGETAAGVALLDEVMVAVTAREVSPIVVGTAYCAVIEACHEIFDVRRAQEWTTALSHWVESQPDLALYRGQCLVHRSEIMRLHGEWPDAIGEAQRARERLSDPPGQPAVGAAYYELAELSRLRGEFAEAEDSYRRANQWGRDPQPGLALLRLAQGRVETAAAAIGRAMDEARDRLTRAKLLPAQVEITLASGDTQAARRAADELSQIAMDLAVPFLVAVSAHMRGAALLASGDSRGSVTALRAALTIWQELDAPYEAARVRVLIGQCCRELGDSDTAEMELDAATKTFGRLGATPDLAMVEGLSKAAVATEAGGLTARELEVLRLVATGETNKGIAAELILSERTVDRHVSNILAKLGVPSRAAATAYAYEHRLV